jgi:hypothetical protein
MFEVDIPFSGVKALFLAVLICVSELIVLIAWDNENCGQSVSPRDPGGCKVQTIVVLVCLTLRSVLSLSNPQNIEMNFCENMKLVC